VAARTPSIKATPLGLHYVPAALAGGAYVGVSLLATRAVLLERVDDATRLALYISLTTTCAALLGFAITAVTILLALGGGRRVAWLYKTEEFKYVRTIFLGAVNALALGTLYFSTLIVVDTTAKGHWYWEAGGCAIVVLLILRIARIIRLLSDLLEIAIADRTDGGAGNPPFLKPTAEDDVL
jgi:hypothetical protein